jgi:hypothetical protein
MVNTGGHAVDTWTGLLIDLIYNFDNKISFNDKFESV